MMFKITGTFDSFWQSIEADVKDLGISDGDLAHARSSVKSVLVAAGWADPSGSVNFLSESDKASCKAAAEAEVARLAPVMNQSRKLSFSAGFQPTKNSLTASTTTAAGAFTEMANVQTVSSNFSPALAKLGDACPRCSGTMQPVGLVNDRAALYCPKDRVVQPLPLGVSLR
jgi:hypothetical protein